MKHVDNRQGATRRSRGGTGIALVIALVVSACGPESAAPDAELGRARFALELPEGATIERVDYDLRFTFLESEPPFVYNEESYSSVRFGGELVTILPCHTGPDGTGMNQVDVKARVWVPGRSEPYAVAAAGIFECKRNADTLVNITLSVLAQLDMGFIDGDFIPIGTLCSAKTDLKDGGWRGTCPDSICGRDEDEIFFFANKCQTVQAANPTYWFCGNHTDWQVIGNVANAFFPIPEKDGEWHFGVTALDAFQMVQVDPTLTDATGRLTVWTGAAAQRAKLVKEGGQITVNETDGAVFEFAADLEVTPQAVGQPTPHLLLLLDHKDVLGPQLMYQAKMGACDIPTDEVSLYPGLLAIDMRRDGPTRVKIIFADMFTSLASRVATCETYWNTSGPSPRPAIRCGAPEPLLNP